MSRARAFARKAVIAAAITLATACGPVPDDPECVQMRQIGDSAEKLELIEGWIEAVLEKPQALSSSLSGDGLLRHGSMDPDLDWAELGIPDYRAKVEFFGESLDLENVDPNDVEAVMVGFGTTYKLVFI